MSKNRRSKKDYEYFRKRVNRWQDFFGVTNWEIVTRFEDIGPHKSAEVERFSQGRFAAIILNTRNLLGPTTKNDLRCAMCKSAFHEIMHLILADLHDAAVQGIGEDRTERIEENTVRIFEQVVHPALLELFQLRAETRKK